MGCRGELVKNESFLLRVGSIRLLRAQTLSVSFKKPWNYLAKTNVAVSATASFFERNSLWVEVRGFEPLASSLRTTRSTN